MKQNQLFPQELYRHNCFHFQLQFSKLNTNTGEYEPPVARPANEGHKQEWDEDNQKWKRIKVIADDGSLLDPAEITYWNPSTSSWEQFIIYNKQQKD